MFEIQNIILTGLNGAYIEEGNQGKKGYKKTVVDRRYNGIMMCIEGECVFTQNGKKYTLNPNTIIVLPKGADYEAQVKAEGRFPKINFSAIHKISDEIIEIPITSVAPYIEDFKYFSQRCFILETRISAFKTLYDLLIRLDNEGVGKRDILSPIVKFIQLNYFNPLIDNELLAKKGNISVVYLIKLFNEKYGMSPHKYIIDVRIKAAKRMLSTTEKSIDEISAMCGFASNYHFSRQFKLYTNMSPSYYRNKHRTSGV